MQTIAAPSHAQATLEDGLENISHTGTKAAREDAEQALQPDTPFPTPADAAVLAEGARWRERLRMSQTEDAADAKDELVKAVAHQVQVTGHDFDPVLAPPPPGRRLRAAAGGIALGIVGVAAGEATALEQPIETIRHSTGGENLLLASLPAIGAALLAHGVVRACWKASRTHGSNRASAQRNAFMWGAGLLLIAVMAIVARSYQAVLDAQLTGDGGFDGWGATFWVIWQLVFIAINLGLAALLHHVLRVAHQRAAAGDLTEAETQSARSRDLAPEQDATLTAGIFTALVEARGVLAHTHPSPAARSAWAARTGRELLSGSMQPGILFVPVLPDEPELGTPAPAAPDDPPTAEPFVADPAPADTDAPAAPPEPPDDDDDPLSAILGEM